MQLVSYHWDIKLNMVSSAAYKKRVKYKNKKLLFWITVGKNEKKKNKKPKLVNGF